MAKIASVKHLMGSIITEKIYLGLLVVIAGFCILTLLLFSDIRWPLFLMAALVATIIGSFAIRHVHLWQGSDERAMKIYTWSCRNAFITIMALAAFLAVGYDLGDHMSLLPRHVIDIDEALYGIGIVMFVVFVVWNVYYSWRGDVE